MLICTFFASESGQQQSPNTAMALHGKRRLEEASTFWSQTLRLHVT